MLLKFRKYLPAYIWRLLLDRVIKRRKGEYIEAYKNVSISEPVFQGHFPNHPIYPGVMIIEGLAQAGGVAFQSSSNEEQKDIENKVYIYEYR